MHKCAYINKLLRQLVISDYQRCTTYRFVFYGHAHKRRITKPGTRDLSVSFFKIFRKSGQREKMLHLTGFAATCYQKFPTFLLHRSEKR